MLRIKRLLGQHVPISEIQWLSSELEFIKENELEFITFCKLLPSRYQVQVLKSIIELIELDEIIVYLSTLFTTNSDGFKVFFMQSGEMISLVENRELISQGTTGLRTWGASLYLVEYFHQKNVRGKKILELGSGLGLLSMALKLMGNQVHATDCQVVLERLQHNITLNNLDIPVSLLNWHEPELDWDGDLIVCADVVFDPSLIEPLLNTIGKYLLGKTCIMACTKRNQETWDFLESMLEKRFLVTKVSIKPNWFVYQEQSPIHIFILVNKSVG
jgi:2-polyprenyl-3-methyl-5-hydroxy-6-metoxy-1,4-benzoquinol methylase